jgi:hypothetical protein
MVATVFRSGLRIETAGVGKMGEEELRILEERWEGHTGDALFVSDVKSLFAEIRRLRSQVDGHNLMLTNQAIAIIRMTKALLWYADEKNVDEDYGHGEFVKDLYDPEGRWISDHGQRAREALAGGSLNTEPGGEDAKR